MKILSTTSLALALVLGAATGTIVVQPALAKEKKEEGPKLSPPVRNAIAAAQTAMKTADTATALAKVAEARQVAVTEDDRYVIGGQLYDISKTTKDTKAQAEGIDLMIQSGRVPQANLASFNMALGQLSYLNQDYVKAESALAQALALNSGQRELYALAAETKYKLKKPAEAVALLQQAADAASTSAAPMPQDWYARGIAIGAEAKLGDAVTKLSQSWLKAYPSEIHWRDALSLYRDLHTLDMDYSLDVMRLQRAAGAMRGERDYVEYAEATYLRLPNEAKSVVDSGVKSGALSLTQSRAASELTSIASGKIAADKASLTKNVTTAKGAVGTADAYASYGDNASAIELYRKALSMGGVDANLVNTRLAVALFKSGQKDVAKQIFAGITGPRADLARYWLTFIDQPVAAPPAAATPAVN